MESTTIAKRFFEIIWDPTKPRSVMEEELANLIDEHAHSNCHDDSGDCHMECPTECEETHYEENDLLCANCENDTNPASCAIYCSRCYEDNSANVKLNKIKEILE